MFPAAPLAKQACVLFHRFRSTFLRPAGAVLVKELRCLLRDQHTVIYSLLVPVFLYPLLVWGAVQGITYARGLQDRYVPRIRVTAMPGAEADAQALTEALGELGKVEIASDTAGEATDDTVAAGEISSGSFDAWLRVAPAAADRPDLDAQIEVVFSSVRDESRAGRKRIESAVAQIRERRLEILAERTGGGLAILQPVAVEEENRASGEEVARHVAALLLPVLMLVMTALGALYPALDVTVGERERGSLETTLLSPAGRGAIVFGKYLAVVAFSLTAFSLNLVSLSISLFHQGSVLKLSAPSLEWGVVGVICVAAVLVAGSLSAIMMLLAFQARTFKEGQSYVMPVYMLAVVPAVVLAAPEVHPGPALAFVPILNIAVLFREALQGSPPTDFALITLTSSTVYAAGLLYLAASWLRRTEVVAGSGGLRSLLWWRRDAAAPARAGTEGGNAS